MSCEHERLRCVNNVYFCATCGAKIEQKPQDNLIRQGDALTPSPKGKAVKRTAKKGDK